MRNKNSHHINRDELAIGQLLHRVTRTHMERIHGSFERYGIQKTFGPILNVLSISEGMTQIELADAMRITAPSMSVNLQKMEGAGLLIRKTDDDDMRQIRLYLTDEGRETAQQADREITLAEEKLVEALAPDEQQEFKRLLLKMLDNQEEEG